VTFTAGVEKIFHPDPRIGFLAQATVQEQNMLAAKNAANTLDEAVREKALKDLHVALHLYANNIIDAVVAGLFLILVTSIFLMSVREWLLLIARKKAANLRETPPTWLPDYALAQAKPLSAVALPQAVLPIEPGSIGTIFTLYLYLSVVVAGPEFRIGPRVQEVAALIARTVDRLRPKAAA